MKLKLLVVSHKKKFGSVMRFCGDLTPEEKLILDSIIYRKYPHSTTDINEMNINSFHIYFMVFFGGKDEFGRDYRVIISAIFPFALSVREGQKLKLEFQKIKEDIEKGRFRPSNKYYADVRKRVNWSTLFSRKIKLSFFTYMIFNLFILGLILYGLSYFRPVKEFYKYLWVNNYSIYGRNYMKKHNLAKEFAEIQNKNAQIWLEKADDQAHYLTKRFISENPKKVKEGIAKIDEYLNTKEFSLHRDEFIKLKKELVQK